MDVFALVAVGSLSDFYLTANGILDASWEILDTGCWKKWIKNRTINKNSASSFNHSVHNSIKLSFVLVLEFFIFPAKALNAAGCVNKFLLTGEKWMAF